MNIFDEAEQTLAKVRRITEETAAPWISETVKPGTVAPPLRSDSDDEYISTYLPPGTLTGRH